MIAQIWSKQILGVCVLLIIILKIAIVIDSNPSNPAQVTKLCKRSFFMKKGNPSASFPISLIVLISLRTVHKKMKEVGYLCEHTSDTWKRPTQLKHLSHPSLVFKISKPRSQNFHSTLR